MMSIRKDVTDEMIRVRNGMVIVLQDAINNYNKQIRNIDNYKMNKWDDFNKSKEHINTILNKIDTTNGYKVMKIKAHTQYVDDGHIKLLANQNISKITGEGNFEAYVIYDNKEKAVVLDVLAEDLLTNEEYEIQYGDPEKFDNMIEQLFIDSCTLFHQRIV